MSLKPVGPICQTKDWYDYGPDGILERRPAITPATLGLTPPAAAGTSPPKAVARGECSYLNPVPLGTVTVPKAVCDRLRGESGAAQISAAKPKASQTWVDGSRSAAVEVQITIDGQQILVTLPTDADMKGKNLPTVQQLAEALRAVPKDQRAFSKKVFLSPVPSQQSTAQRTVGGDAGSGEITLYPVPDRQEQNDFDNRVMHESGHNYQEQLWSGGAQAVAAWQAAARSDDRRPSPYAAQNAGEDFCEFNILYNAAHGTKCEEVAKKIYPNRWAKRESY